MQKNFSENYQQFGHMTPKRFASPVLGLKSLKNFSLKGCLINLQAAHTSQASPNQATYNT